MLLLLEALTMRFKASVQEVRTCIQKHLIDARQRFKVSNHCGRVISHYQYSHTFSGFFEN